MWRVPVDADGLTLPVGSPDEVASTIVALRRASLACYEAVRALGGEPGLAPAWVGDAAGAYRDRRAELSRRCADLAEVTEAAAHALARWMPEAARDRDAMVRARDAVELAERQEQPAAEADAAWRVWTVSKESYWNGIGVLAQRLHALRDGIADRRLSLGEQVEGFVSRVWDDAVAGPARAGWALTGQAFVDRAAWWRRVRAVPGDVRDVVDALVADPLGTAEVMFDVPAWRNGRPGEGAGALAAMFLPTPRWLRLGPEEGAARFARHLPDPGAPLPELQTIDELLAAADLTRHEHATLGHTLSRHVDGDDDFLMDRLTYGTLLDRSGRRGAVPFRASRFTDLARAEDAIAKALRANEDAVRVFAGSPQRWTTVRLKLGEDLGVVMRPRRGLFFSQEGQTVVVSLTKTEAGAVYVDSAYVEVARG